MNDELTVIHREIIDLLPRLRRFAYSLTGNQDDADDLCQATTEKVLKNADKWNDNKQFDHWVFRIAKNLWIDQFRAKKVRGHNIDIDSITENLNELSHNEPETNLLLRQVLSKMEDLTEDQRLLIGLIAIEGYSYKDAADILEIPVGTVMSRLSRARTVLVSAINLKD